MKRRVAQLPLHGGRAPRWLFERMADLSGAIALAIVEEYGPRELLRRLSDPGWFQAFGCVLGFDWHSSGVTTVTCGALKEAQRRMGGDLGLVVAGGKGRASRRTPREIARGADRLAVTGGDGLVEASRMSAKVDSAAVQDGFRVYHHAFFFTADGAWCVVQQGMAPDAGWARRYHWLGESVDDFVCEPHAGIEDLGADPAGEARPGSRGGAGGGGRETLNLVAGEGEPNRKASAELAREDPDRIAAEVRRLTEGPTLFAPDHHAVLPSDVDPEHLRRVLRTVHERAPGDFAALLGTRGVGPAAVRSLALLAEVIHGAPASRRDPGSRWAEYAYAHGGKDGHPFPVDRRTYDRNIEVLADAVRRARLGDRRKSDALRRLAEHARAARRREERGAADGRRSEPEAPTGGAPTGARDA